MTGAPEIAIQQVADEMLNADWMWPGWLGASSPEVNCIKPEANARTPDEPRQSAASSHWRVAHR